MTTDARFRDTLKTLLAALGSSEPMRRQEVHQIIRDTLAVNQKSWNDLITSLQFRGQHSDKLKKLFAMLGQDNDGEFENARQKISDLLARERRTWKAFVDSLFSTSSNAWSDWHDHGASDPAITVGVPETSDNIRGRIRNGSNSFASSPCDSLRGC
jgi:ElaB/YqjD/DUF883 family membrane-anchored ribosome-binding protein